MVTTRKIAKIDQGACRTINAALDFAAKQVAEVYGLTVKVGGGKFDPRAGTFAPKIEFALQEIGGVDRDKAVWDMHCASYSLKPEDFGKVFKGAKGEYRIIGFNLSKRTWAYRAVPVGGGRETAFDYRILKQINEEAFKANKPWEPMDVKGEVK